MKMHLMLAVNDPRNGAHTGQVDQVEVEELDLCLEGDPVSCVYLPHAIMVCGLWFNHKGYQTWVGNWCWDCATLEHVHVATILNHLRSIGWDCTEAETSLFDAYHNNGEITAKMLENLACSPSP